MPLCPTSPDRLIWRLGARQRGGARKEAAAHGGSLGVWRAYRVDPLTATPFHQSTPARLSWSSPTVDRGVLCNGGSTAGVSPKQVPHARSAAERQGRALTMLALLREERTPGDARATGQIGTKTRRHTDPEVQGQIDTAANGRETHIHTDNTHEHLNTKAKK